MEIHVLPFSEIVTWAACEANLVMGVTLFVSLCVSIMLAAMRDP